MLHIFVPSAVSCRVLTAHLPFYSPLKPSRLEAGGGLQPSERLCQRSPAASCWESSRLPPLMHSHTARPAQQSVSAEGSGDRVVLATEVEAPTPKDFVPGLFLRDLWEHRSPSTYADWYANSPSPTCDECGGRALDEFGSDEADKQAVLCHNVHEWLGVHSRVCDLDPVGRRLVLGEERADALAAHLNLRPATFRVEADPVLRELVELDDPQGRRTTPQGAWR